VQPAAKTSIKGLRGGTARDAEAEHRGEDWQPSDAGRRRSEEGAQTRWMARRVPSAVTGATLRLGEPPAGEPKRRMSHNGAPSESPGGSGGGSGGGGDQGAEPATTKGIEAAVEAAVRNAMGDLQRKAPAKKAAPKKKAPEPEPPPTDPPKNWIDKMREKAWA
jgi:hypothetical protein